MAERLIESFKSEWKPEKYKDTYRDELCAIIRAKRNGKDVHPAADVEEEDFKAAKVEGYKTIDIVDFVPYEDIDPIYFAHTYYVGPDRGAEKTYSLLVKAMEGSDLAGVSKFVMRDREILGALRIRDGVITLEQLYYADEIRDVEEIKAARTRVSAEELKMAERLIESFTTDWKPEKYKDTYRDELCAIIRAKRTGKEVHAAPEVEEEAPTDLLTALRESIERSRGGTRTRVGAGRNGDLADLTKQELDRRAKAAGIEGRSKMTKAELVRALRRAA
jgi:DNA end-binding protein Ku